MQKSLKIKTFVFFFFLAKILNVTMNFNKSVETWNLAMNVQYRS